MHRWVRQPVIGSQNHSLRKKPDIERPNRFTNSSDFYMVNTGGLGSQIAFFSSHLF